MSDKDIKKQKESLGNLVIAILNKMGDMPKVKLAKMILFAEIEHYKRTGKSITGLYFVKLKYGPVISFFDEILDENDGKLWKREIKPIFINEAQEERKQFIYKPLKKTQLSKGIETTLEEVVKKYGRKTGTELSNISHSLPAWKYSEIEEPIYIAELSVEKEEDYFRLIDMVEEIEDDDAELANKISRQLSKGKI